MKKYIFCSATIFFAAFICLQAVAQTSSTYLFLKPIYSFSGNAGKLNETSVSGPGVTYTSGVYGSYGKAICLQAGIGKMINNNFGVELAAEWANGRKIKTNYSDSAVNGAAAEHLNALLIKPILVLRNSGDLLSFYSKLGLAISVYSKYYQDVTTNLALAGQTYQSTTSEMDNFKTKVGFTAAFGISCRLSQFVALTAELNGQMITLPVKKGHYTKYIINGKDMLSGLSNSVRSWNYDKTISSVAGDPNQPGVRLYEPANFSYIGIGIGLSYYF